ncbi:MAG: hypothetical protein KC583_10435, partial [Myxococcales bacterium]|nr:hypothetical protein [Myxococcales bacterium]
GHGDLERMTDGGAAHPVWGAHEVSAPDATYEHRSDAHGFGHWENINGRDHHRYSRTDLEAKHGADAMRAAGNTPETVHARMERTLGRDVAAHRERILSALRAHDGREGGQHIGTGAGPLPLAHVARLANRLPGLEGHEPERDLSDATLDGIASGTSSEDAPRFHHEHAVRGVVREAAQSAWQDADGHPSNIRVRKHGQGWNVVHAPSEQVIAGGLATRRAATAAAKMLHARHGDLPEKPKDVIGRKGLPTTVQHLRDHVDTGVLDRAGAILEARDRDAAQRSAVSVAREALDQHNAKPPPTPGEFKVTPTRLSRAKGAARAAQFVSRDVSRPPLRHYHVQDGRAAATDGARLIRFPVDGHVDGFYAGHRDTDGRQRGERVPPEAIGWNYPDYREVIPATTQHTAVVDAAHAREGLQHLVALAGNDREAPVRLSRRDGQITAQSRHPVHGTNHAVLGHHPGDDFDVYLNGHYLHDALSGASGAVQLGVDDAVALGPHKEPRPVKVDREDGEEHVIMPMREPLR